jgi:probable HAF family extracellular repeat protein
MPPCLLVSLLVLGILLGFRSAGQARSYTFTTIALPSASQNWPEAINDQGHVVGTGLTPEGDMESFLYSGGRLSTIQFPAA